MLKIICLFATEKGYKSIKSAIENGYIDNIACVITFKETVSKSFENEMVELCKNNNIDFYFWGGVKNQLVDLVDMYKASGIIAMGWKYLLPISLNDYLKYPLIVFHDSLLPKYRGFSPTPTAIINGDNKTGVTAIFASTEVDKGDVLWSKEVDIDQNDYVQDIINKQSNAYAEGFMFLIDSINQNNLTSSIQDEKNASYSIWRNLDDCKIDFCKSSIGVYNFIRALGTPYPGAFTIYKGKKIFVEKASVENDINFEIRDCGKLWSIVDNCPLVICGEGMIKIKQASYEDGSKVEFDLLRYRLGE